MTNNAKEIPWRSIGPGEIVEALGKKSHVREDVLGIRRLILAEDIRPQLLSQSEIAFYSGAMTLMEIYCWTYNAKLSEEERANLMIRLRAEIIKYAERAHTRA
jgi:hypothetical protein